MFRVIGVIGIFAAVLAAFYPVSACADVLELKNGQKLEGQYAGGSKGEVRFEVGSQTSKVPIAEVSKITIGAAGQEDFDKAAKDVLWQLKALASIVEGGTTYRDYAPRATDAKVKIDRFLEEHKTSAVPLFNERVAESLWYYVVAVRAWSGQVTGYGFAGYKELASHPYLVNCAEAQKELEKSYKKAALSPSVSINPMPPLWQCAKKALAEAEAALKH